MAKNPVVRAEVTMGSKFQFFQWKTFFPIHWQVVTI